MNKLLDIFLGTGLVSGILLIILCALASLAMPVVVIWGIFKLVQHLAG